MEVAGSRIRRKSLNIIELVIEVTIFWGRRSERNERGFLGRVNQGVGNECSFSFALETASAEKLFEKETSQLRKQFPWSHCYFCYFNY